MKNKSVIFSHAHIKNLMEQKCWKKIISSVNSELFFLNIARLFVPSWSQSTVLLSSTPLKCNLPVFWCMLNLIVRKFRNVKLLNYFSVWENIFFSKLLVEVLNQGLNQQICTRITQMITRPIDCVPSIQTLASLNCKKNCTTKVSSPFQKSTFLKTPTSFLRSRSQLTIFSKYKAIELCKHRYFCLHQKCDEANLYCIITKPNNCIFSNKISLDHFLFAKRFWKHLLSICFLNWIFVRIIYQKDKL